MLESPLIIRWALRFSLLVARVSRALLASRRSTREFDDGDQEVLTLALPIGDELLACLMQDVQKMLAGLERKLSADASSNGGTSAKSEKRAARARGE